MVVIKYVTPNKKIHKKENRISISQLEVFHFFAFPRSLVLRANAVPEAPHTDGDSYTFLTMTSLIGKGDKWMLATKNLHDLST